MKRVILSLLLAALTLALQAARAQEQPRLCLASPDGRNRIEILLDGDALLYTIHRDGHQLIAPSRMGLEMDNLTWERALARRYPQYDSWMQGFVADSVSVTTEHRDTVATPLGEQARVPERYNAATLHLSKHDGSRYRLDVEVRAFDEGVAFRYFLPEHPLAVFHKVVADLTEYTFDASARVWAASWAQAPYELKRIDDVSEPIERASVVVTDSLVCALADADVDDWCHSKHVASPTRPHTLATTMYSPVDLVTYAASPWHIVLTADSYAQLVGHRYIIDLLNPPCAIADADQWVRPGTIMRCTTLTTEAARRCIDFCAQNHIPYMLFDWKWYEPCTSHDGDATQVIPAIDMPTVVAYGREHGVGIWLYVNQHALTRQAETLFPLFHEWGIVGVKSGFVEYASHRWAVWLHDLVRLAARHHLMMNIHDEYRPSGFSRTYPNLLTQEGIRGNEEFPSARHNTILPFTRMINGAADYTICYFDPRLRVTHGHQLAASLTFFSPLQTIFWYDTPERIQPVDELQWFRSLPTTWDESRILDGEPGDFVVTARRKGDIWRVAVLGGDSARTVRLPLAQVLGRAATDATRRVPTRKGEGQKAKAATYDVTLYEDDPQSASPTRVSVRTLRCRARDVLTLPLQPSGGCVLTIAPAKP